MATTTITTTSAEDARIVKAFGRYLVLGRNATAAEVKAALVTFLQTIVRDSERQDAIDAETTGFTNVAPT
jgi:hypothetical protein